MTTQTFHLFQQSWALVALLLMGIGQTHAAPAKPPNVVLIISDDQYFADFGFMGNPFVQTPHLDALAARSARFVNGSVPTSVCSPSLATLLTGLYPHQHHIHFNHPPPGNSSFNRMQSLEKYIAVRSRSFARIQQLPTLPRLLAQHRGYRCLQTGKFWEGHFHNAGFTDGMTLFQAVPGQEFGGNRRLADGSLAPHGNGDWGLKIGRETMLPIETFLNDVPQSPFFLWYAPYLPHQPHDAPEEFFDLYRDQPEVPEHQIPYFASISQFDATVGKLVALVEQHQSLADTLFVFVIDNGWQASTTPQRGREVEFAHTRRSKRSPFEPGLRTPILLSWPDRISPQTFSEPVSSLDIVPTILHACSLSEHTRELPGIDLFAVATGQAALNPHRPLFGEIYPGDASSLGHPERDIAYRWIRQDDFKLIVPHHPAGQSAWGNFLKSPALYDLKHDPQETHNLWSDEQHRQRRESLRQQLDSWWDGTAPQ